jgi:long-chain acyl-CoA synthetase
MSVTRFDEREPDRRSTTGGKAWERSYPDGVRWDAALATSTVPALLDRMADERPDASCIAFRERRLTFRGLRDASDQVAASLIAAGVTAGARLALYLPNTPWHPVSFFGGARAGAVLVHLSPLDAEQELAAKLADSGARHLVTTNAGDLAEMAVRLLDRGMLDRVFVGDDTAWGPGDPPSSAIPDHPRITVWRTPGDVAAPPATWPRVDETDVCVLQYTGGTTGVPKGAMLTHANLTAAVSAYDAWFEGQGLSFPGREKVICVLPLFHILALTTILLRQVRNGNEILLRQRFDVATTLDDIETGRATTFPGVPTMWIAIANTPGIETRDLSSLIRCNSGGAPLPVEVDRRLQRLTGVRLVRGWGMTETAPAGTNMPARGPDKPGSIGLPLPGVTLEVVALDDPTRVLPPGETGELRVSGPNVTAGYWNRPEDTAAAFVDGALLTGDIGYMDEDGYFFIVDRRKDLIISGGFNVYPQVIEQAIYQHPAVAEALVIGIPDAYRGESAKAVVSLRPGSDTISLDDLRAFLADKVGRHEMPVALEIRASLPRTSVGKLSKRALYEEERSRLDRPDPTVDGVSRTGRAPGAPSHPG